MTNGSPDLFERSIAMKRSLLAAFATLALVLGLSGPASGAAPPASCSGLVASSNAGQPGAQAANVHDAFDEAAQFGDTLGALVSEFARFHDGSAEVCLGD
jgi:hypothetical protein